MCVALKKIQAMFVFLGVVLLIVACKSDQPTIISKIDSNEIDIDDYLQFHPSIFPTIDPNIAEDITLTTVVIFFLFFIDQSVNRHSIFVFVISTRRSHIFQFILIAVYLFPVHLISLN